MKSYYILSYDCYRDDLDVVSDYEVGDFDITRFWTGEEFRDKIPQYARLWVAAGESSDYLANPLSWPIISNRMWTLIGSTVGQCCQLVQVPLFYEGTQNRVEGYSLMNVTCSVSAVKHAEPNLELSVSDLVLDMDKIPVGVHVFRLAESTTLLIVSDDFRKRITGRHLRGIALIKVKMG